MLTKEKVKVMHADITKALQEVAKKYDLSMAPSRIVYNESTFKFTIEFGDKTATGGADPKLLNNTTKHGGKFGLTVDHIGKTFDHPSLGKTTFRGMSGTLKAGITAQNGKRYLMRANEVAHFFGIKR